MAEYNVEVPASLQKATSDRKKPGRPKESKPAIPAEPVKPAVPKVALDSGRRRVRLRGASYALPCTVSCDGREYSVTLQPNRWTDVPEPIYQMLKHKFGHVQEREVPDWRDGDNPQRTPRMESPNAPIIEGL